MLVGIFEITFDPKLLHFYLSYFVFQFFQNVWRAYFIAKKEMFSLKDHIAISENTDLHSSLSKQECYFFLTQGNAANTECKQTHYLRLAGHEQACPLPFTGLVSEKVKNISYQILRGVRRVRTELPTGKTMAVNRARNQGTEELKERETEWVERKVVCTCSLASNSDAEKERGSTQQLWSPRAPETRKGFVSELVQDSGTFSFNALW